MILSIHSVSTFLPVEIFYYFAISLEPFSSFKFYPGDRRFFAISSFFYPFEIVDALRSLLTTQNNQLKRIKCFPRRIGKTSPVKF